MSPMRRDLMNQRRAPPSLVSIDLFCCFCV